MLVRLMQLTTRRCMVWLILGAMGILSLSGCSRQFWRLQADKDSYNDIGEKLNDPRWELPRVNLTPDQRSRFYDPYDPDKEPLPPDDPAAHVFMHCVNGRRGYKSWHKLGTAFAIENPNWLESYGISMNCIDPVEGHSEVKLLKVTLPELVDLTYIHNRDYQSNLEDLYISALELTQQRYNLGVRYLGLNGREPFADVASTTRGRGPATGVSTVAFGVSQLLPSGGQLAVELANAVTWNFGQGGSISAPLLGYSVTQPLMFQAGRKVVLEPLTQAERTVLYNARSMARFRQTLFVLVARSYLSLLEQKQIILNQINNIRQLEEQYEKQKALDSRKPGVVHEKLENFQELPQLIPDDLKTHFKYDGLWMEWRGPMTQEDQRRLFSLSEDEGYRAAIQQLIGWKNQDATGLASYQLLGRLQSAQAQLAASKRDLSDQQDALKILLGLPPNIQLDIDESGLVPFEIISWELIDLERRMRDIQKQLGEQLLPDLGENQADSPPDFATLKNYVNGLAELRNELREFGINVVKNDFEPVRELLDSTKDDWQASRPGQRYFRSEEERTRLQGNFEKDEATFERSAADFMFGSDQLDMLVQLLDVETLDGILNKLDSDSNGMIERSELPDGWSELPRSGTKTPADTYTVDAFLSEVRDGSRILRDDYMLRLAQQLEVLQAGLRVEAIAINRFTLSDSREFPEIEQVVEIGRENRLDLMNNRALVMDARRRVEIAANTLESTLNLRFDGTQGLSGNNKRSDSNHTASLAFTTPLDQIDERNIYRATLIEYQVQRRSYMLSEDTITLNIRQNWRELQVQEYRLEIDRTAVRNAALQYDSASLRASGAVQTNALDLLQALNTVLSAQNALVGDWITYETNRLNIFVNMGIMQLDPRGVWDDPYYLQMNHLQDDEIVLPAMTPGVVPTNSQPQN
ncbi:MAG: TolC family protein [Planctomycetaceae bacterium]